MRKIALIAAASAACVALAFSIFAAEGTGYSPALWSGLKYRMIGPNRGGRVTAVTGVPSQPFTFYMGSTGGGVWKTTDAGHSWVNISDKYFKVASMGAIEVSLSNPNVIYAGTGSSKIRSNVSIGRGIYKSTDAGQTWEWIGPARHRPDLHRSCEPDESGPGLRGGPWQSVRAQPGPRRLSQQGWRQNVAERSASSPTTWARPIWNCSPATQT